MNTEIIYEKTYLYTDLTNRRIQDIEVFELSEEDYLNFIENFDKNTTYILIPEREKISKDFIKNAIAVSEEYCIDTKIKQGDGQCHKLKKKSVIL